jgi:hypothetical protein
MSWRDEDIMAYIDGEMTVDVRVRFEAALESDAELARRTRQQRRISNRVRSAYASVVNEPVPDRFANLLAADQPAEPNSPAWWEGLRAFFARPFAAQGMVALASLALGLFVGAHFLTSGAGISGQSTLASSQLAAALNAADGNEGWQMPVTFRSDSGQYCRAFQASEAPTRGLACREESGWQVRLLMNDGAAASGGYQLAGSSLPPALLQSIDDMIEGDPLDADSIEAAASSGWVE